MATIVLETTIKADIHVCFDLSRSIDLHMATTSQTGERAIGGMLTGLIGMGQSVTWRAKHFGVTQNLTSKITAFKRPFHFRDEQIKGTFKSIIHDHYFCHSGDYTLMTDHFVFEAPYGKIGQMFSALILTRYMRKFLEERNEVLKEYAESDKWKTLLLPGR